MRTSYPILVACFLFWGCQSTDSPENRPLSAQAIVDSALAINGGERYDSLRTRFDFRGKTYSIERKQGKFAYQRIFSDSLQNEITDLLSNGGAFERAINGEPVVVPPKKMRAYLNSVNSVVYFTLLPYGLNDVAVRKKRLEDVQIKGKDYYKVEVTFAQEGGGEDFQDVFLYWFGKEGFQLDYLAYRYHTDGGGIRFREAYGRQRFKGIGFANYINYKPASNEIDFYQIDQLYQQNELIELSRIENTNFRD